MNELVLHPRSKTKLAAARQELPQAILLSGERGVGLATTAKMIAGKELAGFLEPIDSKGNPNHEVGTISIALIRNLYDQTRAKSTLPRVVIIDDADRMSLGAQAAFLKLLEEPTDQTHFILTSHTVQSVLPTIRSRVQTIVIEPLTKQQSKLFIESLKVKNDRMQQQLEYLAAGLPAELTRLVDDQQYFTERAEVMGDTRTFLTGSPYQKLLVIQKYYSDRAKTLQLIESALLVSTYSLQAKPLRTTLSQIEKLLKAKEKIEGNCNNRLQLMKAIL